MRTSPPIAGPSLNRRSLRKISSAVAINAMKTHVPGATSDAMESMIHRSKHHTQRQGSVYTHRYSLIVGGSYVP